MARFALSLLVATLLLFLGGRAGAEQNNPKATPVYVLDIDTEDSDDQADALTQALRARVRAAQGWSLADTTQSLGKLIVVLKCPVKPDAPCLQRIGDQLKADRFVWGQMTKKASQVTIELHMWTRGKPEARTVETYSENLKDPNDDSLKKIAAKLFAAITNSATTGSVTVRAVGAATGMVLVDGQERAKLDAGVAKLDVPAGAHNIEVRAPGFDAWSQQLNVAPGADQEVTATLVASKGGGEPPPVAVKSNLPVRKYASYAILGAGVIALGIGGFEGIKFLGAKSDLDDDRSKVSSSVQDVCADLSTPAAIDACQKYKNAKDARTLSFIFAGIGAALVTGGVVLLVTDPGTERGKEQAVQVVPTITPRAAGLDVTVRF